MLIEIRQLIISDCQAVNKQFLYHITSLSEWNNALQRSGISQKNSSTDKPYNDISSARSNGKYKPQDFAKEGFIHCSYRNQLLSVAHRFYKGQDGLVILIIESSTIRSNLVEENLEGGTELYPHIYCPLPINSVIKAVAFPCDAEGGFTLPEELKI